MISSTFERRPGVSHTFRVDVRTVQRVRQVYGVDLAAGVLEVCRKLEADPVLFVTVAADLLAIPEAEWESFAEDMTGDTLFACFSAFMGAVVGFTPTPARRRVAGVLIQKALQATAAQQTEAAEQLEALTTAELRALLLESATERRATLSENATSQQPSSASTPADGPLASSTKDIAPASALNGIAHV